MRQVSEVKPEFYESIIKNVGGVFNMGLNHYAKPQYYGKLRAYLFVNFTIIGLVLLLLTLRMIIEEGMGPGFAMLLLTALDGALCYLIWRGVAKKIQKSETRVVFWSFLSTGLFVFAKVIMYMTIILIPLVGMVGGEDTLEYRYVESGAFAGRYVLSRRKLNGQIEDNYGNIYED